MENVKTCPKGRKCVCLSDDEEIEILSALEDKLTFLQVDGQSEKYREIERLTEKLAVKFR